MSKCERPLEDSFSDNETALSLMTGCQAKCNLIDEINVTITQVQLLIEEPILYNQCISISC